MVAAASCEPREVDPGTWACTCTQPRCNGDIQLPADTEASITTTSTASTTITSISTATTSTAAAEPTVTTPRPRVREHPSRVRCHQCGNFLSGAEAPPCEDFSPASSQQGLCQVSEGHGGNVVTECYDGDGRRGRRVCGTRGRPRAPRPPSSASVCPPPSSSAPSTTRCWSPPTATSRTPRTSPRTRTPSREPASVTPTSATK